MRKSKIAARLRAGQPVKLGMLGYFLPPYIAYAAHEGYDGIWLDLEHRPFEVREVQSILAFCHLYDIDCMVRPNTRERAALYRYLEDGAAALMMPHVNDLETAKALVQAVKFPPIGDRGIEGNGFETNFGLDTGGDRQVLVNHARQETLLALQIETPQALELVEDFAALEGVDMLYIGPSDLALRLDLDATLPSSQAALEQVAAVCRRHHKAWGSMPRTLDDMRQFAQLGAQLMVWGHDQRLLRAGLQQANAELDAIFNESLA